MNKWLKVTSWWDVLKHLGYIALIGISAILFFFYIYLPIVTNHGETITVPDVRGVAHDQLDDFLVERNLRYEISKDSGYDSEQPPQTVLEQVPAPLTKVKENRKIYLTLNSQAAPRVKMPDLVDMSVKMAQMVLKTYDLKLGKIDYVPDIIFNTVLAQEHQGESVEEGELLPKGSVIDLKVGDGYGNQNLKSPNLVGLDLESAQVAIIGSGLKVGEIAYQNSFDTVIMVLEREGRDSTDLPFISPGEVFKQKPVPEKNMRLEDEVDLWIYQPDTANTPGPASLEN
jgi:beta-lactam-binding protein with PASTA domain